MSSVSIAMSFILVLSFAVLILGLAKRVWLYAATPAALRIPTTPAPVSRAGAALRVGREVVLFESLFKASRVLWLFSMLFHVGLLLVLVRHLRYFVPAPPALLVLIQPLGLVGAAAMVAGLTGLLLRRLLLPQVRYVTRPTDFAILGLLLAIAITGLAMAYLVPTDIIGLKDYLEGLWRLELRPLPGDPLLVLHLLLVAALMVVAPFSKLLHFAGIFFSPTRNQADNPRERRHLAPWARPLDDVRA